ncbi:MAG TPA: YegS/Rv2252/BmrU family lipid kinase [Bdellovibrionota bacterium]|jgi:YegS/Rv2252/BmrU family lipid kinase|nr:YegS/Rv2252/BmrU family lipid kinase [Bdellovibrionota bacterium]
MRKALVIINAKASQASETFDRVAESLRAQGIEILRGEPRSCADYTPLILKHSAEIDVVIVGGGDGTLQCAAEALRQTKIPLGILPLGTANNVARSLGVPLTLEDACRVIATGVSVPMDLARVNDRLFVSVAGIGFSTEVHKSVPSQQKKRWGSISYAFQALRLLMSEHKGFRVEVENDRGEITRAKALQVTVVNGKYYGAHVQVHNEASLDDAMLDVSIIKTKNYLKGFFRALLPTKRNHHSQGLSILRAKKFTIRTLPPKEIDVEGATDFKTPATFEVLPAAINVMVPRREG